MTDQTRVKFFLDGEPVEALTYLRHNPGDAARPSPEYLTLIQQGYKDWRLI